VPEGTTVEAFGNIYVRYFVKIIGYGATLQAREMLRVR
jgi:hypothetical protein